ncbi:MAG TPA: hypothetical protein DEQ09_04900 [Bacteroidales bacterium]|nr:hypothetical protein [Bacteroidales bacterium]
MLVYYQRKAYLLRFNRDDNTINLYCSLQGGPDLIRSAELISITNNRMYWIIPDRILLSPNSSLIADYGIQEFIEYRRKLPEGSNPFIIELTVK